MCFTCCPALTLQDAGWKSVLLLLTHWSAANQLGCQIWNREHGPMYELHFIQPNYFTGKWMKYFSPPCYSFSVSSFRCFSSSSVFWWAVCSSALPYWYILQFARSLPYILLTPLSHSLYLCVTPQATFCLWVVTLATAFVSFWRWQLDNTQHGWWSCICPGPREGVVGQKGQFPSVLINCSIH